MRDARNAFAQPMPSLRDSRLNCDALPGTKSPRLSHTVPPELRAYYLQSSCKAIVQK